MYFRWKLLGNNESIGRRGRTKLFMWYMKEFFKKVFTCREALKQMKQWSCINMEKLSKYALPIKGFNTTHLYMYVDILLKRTYHPTCYTLHLTQRPHSLTLTQTTPMGLPSSSHEPHNFSHTGPTHRPF